MFDFQKHRRNRERLDALNDRQSLNRIFRVDDIPAEPKPTVVFVPCHSLDLESQLAHRIQQRLDVIMIADSGSSVGVSLHDADLSSVLKAAEIKPLDISEIIGRNRSQR